MIARLFNLFCPQLNTPTYKLTKFLIPVLKSLISNEYTVKDSLACAVKIVEQDSKFL